MDVAIVNRIAGMTRGGGEMWDLSMAEALANRGVNVSFYVGRPLFGSLEDPITDYEVVKVRTPHLRDLAYGAPRGIGGALSDIDTHCFLRRAATHLESANHDIIQVTSDPGFAKYARSFDCPVIIKMNSPPHSFYHDTLNPWSSSYAFFDEFDRVIGTGITPQAIESRTDITVEKINPGIDTELFTPEGDAIAWKQPTILFVGRFVPVKNVSELLSAFAVVVQQRDDAQLVLVGDGPLKEQLEKECRSLGITDAVSFAGYVPHEEVSQYFRGADVFAMSSRHESFGMVLLEAMASGTPPVAPRIDHIPEIITDKESGLLYEQGNSTDLVDKLLAVLEEPDYCTRLGINARREAINQYTWEQQVDKLHTVYEEELATTDSR